MRLSRLRPLNRAVKFQASGSIRRLNSLAANRVFQTEAYSLRAIRFGGRWQQRLSHCNLCAKPKCPRAFWFSPPPTKAVKLSRTPNQTAEPQSFRNAASAAIAVRLSQMLNGILRLRASLISQAPQSRLSSCEHYAALGSLQTSRFRSESRQPLRNREL